MIYDETKIFFIKSNFYDGFGFVIKIFIIEMDISSSGPTTLPSIRVVSGFTKNDGT